MASRSLSSDPRTIARSIPGISEDIFPETWFWVINTYE